MLKSPAIAIVKLEGSKLALGNILSENQFKFSVYDENNNLVTTGYNKINGNIIFDEFIITTPGIYSYIIKENLLVDDNWITDPSIFAVTVTVISDPKSPGGFNVRVEYPDGYPIFKNYYKDQSKGLVEFPCINFTEPGTYNYTVRETSDPQPGWILDQKEYQIAIEVTDDENGNLVPSIEHPDGFPEFKNEYQAKPAKAVFEGYKMVEGAPFPLDAFEFGIFDEMGTLVETTLNNLDGTITFPSIEFNNEGIFYYTVQELTPSGNGWTTDPREYSVIVTVIDDKFGSLIANVEYVDGPIEFNNVYQAEPTEAIITAYKLIKGWNGPTKTFTFKLIDSVTGTVVNTATTDHDGVVEFSPLLYERPGIYYYTIVESMSSGNGWTVDPSSYPVIVTVIDDGEGHLITQVEYPDGLPSFTNTYTTKPICIPLSAIKMAIGAALRKGQFTFSVFDESGEEIVSTTNNAPGEIDFDDLF